MKRSMTRCELRRKLIEQRIIGGMMIVMGVFLGWFTSSAGEDATCAVFIGGLGLFLLLSRKVCVY